MKKYLSQFVMRGFFAAAFGPIVLAIIYAILGATGAVSTLPPGEVALGILSITLMAFIAGGVTMVYQIESLPLLSAILIHGAALYLDYLILYLVNDWLPKNMTAISIFTLIFVAGFALIWLGIYLFTRRKTSQLNKKLQGDHR